MTIALWTHTQLLILIGVAAAALGAAAVLRRRAPRSAAVAILVATTAALALAAHGLLWLLVSAQGESFNEQRWVLLSPWGRIGQALGLGAGLGVIILAWVGTRELLSPGRRVAIVAARIGAVAAALVLFLEPALELRQVAREPNRVAVLLDASASMALRDDPKGPTRLERGLEVLRASRGVMARWSKEHRVDRYLFASDLEAVTEDRMQAASPAGEKTRIRRALEQVRSRYKEEELAGIVLLSDGLATGSFADGAGDGAEQDFLRSLDTRVHTVWVGRGGLRDVAITGVLADEFAFVRTVVKIEAVVRATGYAQKRVPVTLSSEGRALRRKWVDVPADGSEVTVPFEFTPSQVGKYVYEVSTPLQDDEAVEENNRRAFIVRVVRDKFRVLQVAGQPSWDVRALRGMLKQNPNVDLISFFILRTQDDIPQASQNEMSLIPFPTQELFEEQLPSFDLVVLQNFDFEPYGLGPYLDNIRDYVLGGGGLVMLGGELSFASGGYAGTPLAEILPVGLAPPAQTGLLDTTSFVPQLTEAGALHPVTSLRFDEQANRALWAQLPALEGINLVEGLHPDATVLAQHPRAKTGGGRPAPVVAIREVGKGRVLAILTDTLWHWGFVAAADGDGDGRDYDRLWESANRWLIRDPDLELLQVSSQKAQVQPDENVILDIHLRGPDYRPKTQHQVELTVQRGLGGAGEGSIVVIEAVTTDGLGRAVLDLGMLPAGEYRVSGRGQLGEREVTATDVFLVREASAELDRSAADRSLLSTIALVTGGLDLGTADRLPSDLPLARPRVVRVDKSTDMELWSGPWLLVLCLGFLGLEWGLRQRSGYR